VKFETKEVFDKVDSYLLIYKAYLQYREIPVKLPQISWQCNAIAKYLVRKRAY